MARRGRGGGHRQNNGQRGRQHGSQRQAVDPEIMFASYQLTDAQKNRIVFYLTQSAAMFLSQQIESPSTLKQDEARSMIMTHWWHSLCMTRTAQGLSVDVNTNALMYRSYWFGFTEGGSQSPFVEVACQVCDPNATLPEDWLDTCEMELSHSYDREAIARLRERILALAKENPEPEEKAEPQATEKGPEEETEPQATNNDPPVVSRKFAPGESWADRMEMDE
jgi:hypothetical protein